MRILLFLAILICCPLMAQGQALPDLAPREVEIRGDLTIAFPSLRRQPLIGFNPPPRVPDIEMRRMPYVEAYKQESADLPQNPLQNPVTPRALPRAGTGFSGTLETGFGRYAARYALLEASLHSSPASRWTIEGNYDGMTSYAPYGLDAEADGIGGGTRFVTAGPSVSFGVEAAGSSDGYRLYGVDGAGFAGSVAAPRRTRSDLAGGLWLGTGTESDLQITARLEGFSGRTDTEIFTDRRVALPTAATERTDAGLEAGIELATGALRLDGSAGMLTLDGGDQRAVGHFDGGGGLRLRLGGAATLFAGARILGMESRPADGSRRTLTYASPELSLEAAIAPNLRLEVTQHPTLSTTRPGNVLRENPYLLTEFQIEPVVYHVDAVARLRGFFGALQASLIATWKEADNWRVFEHESSEFGYARGLSNVRYTAARTVTAGGEIRLSPRPGVEARLGARVQDGQMTDLEADLPYFASWTADGLVSVAFSENRGLLQATTRLIGPRSADPAETVDVPAFADLDLRVSYSLGGGALIVGELRNLLGETPYWFNYPEPPATALIGFGWRW